MSTQKLIRALTLIALAITTGILGNGLTATALTPSSRQGAIRSTPLYNLEESGSCSTDTPTSETTGDGNKDYAGRPIFTQAQLDAINKNKSTYEQAAGDKLPWQMLAVMHIRESGASRINPSNGQGLFQFVDGRGGPYPHTGQPVSDAEFLRQVNVAVDFIMNVKMPTNYPQNRALGKTPTIAALKDTFFSYNGRAGVYADQAAKLGFDRNTQGYEGSPYVMNKADAKRDPATAAPGTWGQIKRDYGPIEYPANADYGAFVQYAGLSGVSSTGGGGCDANAGDSNINCTPEGGATAAPATGAAASVRKKVVCLAQNELKLWQTGQLKPNTNAFHKYSQGRSEDWCADFVSWLYFTAGYPFDPATQKDGNIAYVPNIQAMGMKNVKFEWHPIGTYTPQPGDVMIQGSAHTNLVVAVGNGFVKTIGGNQGGNGSTPFYSGSSVTTYDMKLGSPITGFVSPKGN